MMVLILFLVVLLISISIVLLGKNIKTDDNINNDLSLEITSFCCGKNLFLNSLRELDKDKQWLETIVFLDNNKEKHFIGMLAEGKKVSYIFDTNKFNSLEELITYSFIDEDYNIEILGVGEWLEDLNNFNYKIECDIRQYEELFDLINKFY